MDDNYYPPLNESNVGIIAKLYENNPNYFEDPACPYNSRTKEIFKGMAAYTDFDSHAPDFEVPETDQMLIRINNLYEELQKYGKEAEKSADKSTFFRLSVSLMKDLVDLKQKVSNLSEHEKFIAEVLAILDDVCNPDQRGEFQERLKRFTEEK